MGYDPYDYYDLGDIDQKGSIPTWFGSRSQLEELIKEVHLNRMQVYADIGYKGNVPNQWNGVPDDVLKQYNVAYTEKELKECVSFDKA